MDVRGNGIMINARSVELTKAIIIHSLSMTIKLFFRPRKNGIGEKFTFWAAAPKGRCPVEHRGEFRDIRPSVLPSLRPPPVDHQGLKLALPGLNLALQA